MLSRSPGRLCAELWFELAVASHFFAAAWFRDRKAQLPVFTVPLFYRLKLARLVLLAFSASLLQGDHVTSQMVLGKATAETMPAEAAKPAAQRFARPRRRGLVLLEFATALQQLQEELGPRRSQTEQAGTSQGCEGGHAHVLLQQPFQPAVELPVSLYTPPSPASFFSVRLLAALAGHAGDVLHQHLSRVPGALVSATGADDEAARRGLSEDLGQTAVSCSPLSTHVSCCSLLLCKPSDRRLFLLLSVARLFWVHDGLSSGRGRRMQRYVLGVREAEADLM